MTLYDLFERGVAPLGPPAPAQPPLFGCGEAPPATAPDLGHRVALLGHASVRSVAASVLLLHCPGSRSGGATVRRYSSFKVRSTSYALLEQP